MTLRPSPDCTDADHDAIRHDAALWLEETHPVGAMPDGEGGMLELGNCRRCQSTLARPMQKAEPRAVANAAAARAMAPALGLCATCGADVTSGGCETCTRLARGESCCSRAVRVDCYCAAAWTCPRHGISHFGTHD